MQSVSFDGGAWLNPPMTASCARETLTIVTDAQTDFWRETFYGFTRDTGHAFLFEQPRSFTAEIRVEGRYEALYDQAGLMVRIDDRHWMKAGVELTDGHLRFSTVLTDGRSDWSVTSLDGDLIDVRLRVTVHDGSLRVQGSLDGTIWPLLRLAPFPAADRYLIGPMAASPQRAGFQAVFSEFRCGPASTKELHDLS